VAEVEGPKVANVLEGGTGDQRLKEEGAGGTEGAEAVV
jgi:hypothetical protein